MFQNLQKAKTFCYYKEDPRKEGVPPIEVRQLATPTNLLKDYIYDRPKLPHAKTAITLGHRDYSYFAYNSNIRQHSRNNSKAKSCLDSRPIRIGPLEYINLVSKSELMPKEPRAFSFISYRFKSSNENKKSISQNEYPKSNMSNYNFEVNNFEGSWNRFENQNERSAADLPLEEKVEIKEIEKKQVQISEVVVEEEKNKKKLKDLKSNKVLIGANNKRVFIEEMRRKSRHQVSRDSDSEEANSSSGSIGEDWLIKWSILKNSKLKKHEEVFNRYDLLNAGHISGDPLVQAIQAVHKLSNTKLSYLFNVLNLCEVDPFERGADLKLFKIITSLAEKISNLDNEWFFNLLPQLDIDSVENKAFKIRRLWSYLVNSKTKTFTRYDLLIEFEAGGVTREHIEFARRKFSDNLYFEITDYITYIPLFLLIHDRIVNNPFGKYEAI